MFCLVLADEKDEFRTSLEMDYFWIVQINNWLCQHVWKKTFVLGEYFCVVMVMVPSLSVSRVNRSTPPTHTLPPKTPTPPPSPPTHTPPPTPPTQPPTTTRTAYTWFFCQLWVDMIGLIKKLFSYLHQLVVILTWVGIYSNIEWWFGASLETLLLARVKVSNKMMKKGCNYIIICESWKTMK